MLPQIAHVRRSRSGSQILPSQIDALIGVSQIEDRHVPLSWFCSVRHPRADTASIQRLMPAMTVLIDLQNFLIRDQRCSGGGVTRQNAARNQGGGEKAPQGKYRPAGIR